MIVELENGKEVRFVSGGNGLQGAAYDCNSGDGRDHLHVYLSTFKTFACSNKSLTREELGEAERLAEEQIAGEEQYGRDKQEAIDALLLQAQEVTGFSADDLMGTQESHLRHFINEHAEKSGLDPQMVKSILFHRKRTGVTGAEEPQSTR